MLQRWLTIKRILKWVKVTGALLLLGFLCGFVYFGLSISKPTFIIEPNPAVNIRFEVGENNETITKIDVTGFRFRYRFGGHFGLNPVFSLADKLLQTSVAYHLCFKGIRDNLFFERYRSSDWATLYGWSHFVNRNLANGLLDIFPRKRVITEAALVAGECATLYQSNQPLSKYVVFFIMPKLDTYSNHKLSNISLDQAMDEFKSRISYDAGFTRLNQAIRRNCLECVISLVNDGVNVNREFSGENALLQPHQRTKKEIPNSAELAMEGGNYAIFEYLLSVGGEINLPSAAEPGRYEYLLLQVEHGADINTKDAYGRTALEVAVRHGCLDCAKLLVSKGAEINTLYRNQTPLNMALLGNNYEMTRYLLEQGADKGLRGRGMSAYELVKQVEYVKDRRILELFGVVR